MNLSSNAVQLEPPPFFSWVEKDLFAAMGLPSKTEHIDYLRQNGVKTVISLTEKQPPIRVVAGDIKWIDLPVIDFTPPSTEQIEQFLQIMKVAEETKMPIAIHCMHGRGRTGTLIAIYLMTKEDLSPSEAIEKTRILRPGSIETDIQEEAIIKYYDKLHNITWSS